MAEGVGVRETLSDGDSKPEAAPVRQWTHSTRCSSR